MVADETTDIFLGERPKKEYGLVDVAKLSFSVVVVAVHVFGAYSTNAPLHNTLNVLTQIGMAFFFVASGFFTFQKYATTQDNRVFGKSAARLLILYGLYNVLYYLVRVLVPGLAAGNSLSESTLAFLRDMLIGGTSVMWFIWDLIVFYGILFFITWKPIKLRKFVSILLVVGFLLYCLCFLFFDSYGFLFLDRETATLISGNWAYFGLLRFFGECCFFVPIGFLASFLSSRYLRKGLLLLGFGIGLGGFLLEYILVRYLVGRMVCFGFAMPLLAFFGFAVIAFFDQIPPHPVFRFMRNMSTAIYLIHTPITNIMHQLFKSQSVPTADGLIPFVVILALSCLYFLLVYWAKWFKPFRWLRYLY